MDKRAAIFSALAQGLDLPAVRERFDLTPEALQELFRNAADLFRAREAGFWQGTSYFVLIGLACLWDTIDGGVARAQKRVTKFGYYLEGIIDKWVEVIIYLGLAVSGYALEAFLVISASLLLSFAKPRAAMVVPLGEHDWPAIGERFERLLLLNVGLLVSLFWPVVHLGRHTLPTLALFLRALFVMVLVGGVQRILYAKKIIERGGLDKMKVATRTVFNHEEK